MQCQLVILKQITKQNNTLMNSYIRILNCKQNSVFLNKSVPVDWNLTSRLVCSLQKTNYFPYTFFRLRNWNM